MTVAELIAELQKHPGDLEVRRQGDEWDTVAIERVMRLERHPDDIPLGRPVRMPYLEIE